MLKNYIKTAFRALGRNKMLSFVNIAGLSIALACMMLIMLFVNDEFSFDKGEPNAKRIYRLVSHSTDSSGVMYRRGITGLPQGPAFAADIPEIESFCRLKGWNRPVKKGNNALTAKVLHVDASFFDVFSCKVLKGDKNRLLYGRNTVVLTEDQAEKYFGGANPVGKTIDIQVDDDFESYLVTGVVEGAPINSSIRFDMLIPFEQSLPLDAKDRSDELNDWNSSFLNTFFLLHKNANAKAVEAKFKQAFLKYNGKSWQEFKEHYGKNVTQTYLLQPFLQMHLTDEYNVSNGLANASDISYSYILTALGVLILVIACINFVNIMLARSVMRSKEIGVRKVTGGSKGQLMLQFLSESAVIAALAFVPALCMVQLFLPKFGQLANKHFDITYLFQPTIVLLFAGLWVVVSLLAGAYPAFVAAGFKPVQTLYGKFKLSGRNILGKSLVVMQFALAAALVICTVVFQRQFNYMTNSDKGYKPDNIIRVDLPYRQMSRVNAIKQQLAATHGIAQVGAKGGDYNKIVFTISGKETDWTYYENIDDNYFQILQIPLVKGRYLSYKIVADTISNCMINQAFVDVFLDKSRSPIGQIIVRNGKPMEVVGVVKNYHSSSFREKIEPVYFSLDKQGWASNLLVKYTDGEAASAMTAVRRAGKSVFPYDIIDYNFLDDWTRQLYSVEERWKAIITYASVIAIAISCLGLFALTTLAMQQRVKEIGIRKVLGASVSGITALLSKSFLQLVFVAFLIALPVAWYLMNNWLQGFAYRITLSWWMFVITAGAILLLALLTVSYHIIKAALANPVKSLRSE